MRSLVVRMSRLIARSLLLFAAVLLIASTAEAGPTITITNYEGQHCTSGSSSQVVPADVCLPTRDGRTSSTKFTIGSQHIVFFQMEIMPGSNCTAGEGNVRTAVPCGTCVIQEPFPLFSKFECSPQGNHIIASAGCAPGCVDCTFGPQRIDVGGCQSVPTWPFNGTANIKVGSFFKTQTLDVSVFDGDLCSSPPIAGFNNVPCNYCYGRQQFNCSS